MALTRVLTPGRHGMHRTPDPAPLEESSRLALQWNAWALAPLVLLCAAIAAPYCSTHNLLLLGFALQHAFALVCHQRPERSFWIFGAPVAICARCLGIYTGAAVGLLLRTSRTLALRLLIAAAAVNILDAAAELAGLHGNWMGVRFVLGLTLGAAAALLISSSMPLGAYQRQATTGRSASIHSEAQRPGVH